MIELLYLASGLMLPLFYVPQILKIQSDNTLLEAYSISKALIQLLLRFPSLLFACVIVDNFFMNTVLLADILGRAIELVSAYSSLKRQGVGSKEIWMRVVSLRN